MRLKNIKNNKIVSYLLEDTINLSREIGIALLAGALRQNVPQTRRMLNRWQGYGYLKISKDNNKTFFKFTSRGLNFIELLKFSSGKLRWDRRWRILIFDIPEKQKYKRNFLRQKLIELGFYQLQKSVWITPFPLPTAFSDFLSTIKVHPFLYSITVEKINREGELKRYFNLK